MPKKARKKIGIRKKVYKAKSILRDALHIPGSELWNGSPSTDSFRSVNAIDCNNTTNQNFSPMFAKRSPTDFRVIEIGPGKSACTSSTTNTTISSADFEEVKHEPISPPSPVRQSPSDNPTVPNSIRLSKGNSILRPKSSIKNSNSLLYLKASLFGTSSTGTGSIDFIDVKHEPVTPPSTARQSPTDFRVVAVEPGQLALTSSSNPFKSSIDMEEVKNEPISPPISAGPSSSAVSMKKLMSKIFNIVQKGVSFEWLVLHAKPGIQMVELICGEMCQVKRSIFFSNDGQLTIHIHNKPLTLPSNILIDSEVLQDLLLTQGSPLDIAKIILKITGLVSKRICPGNFEDTYGYLWSGSDDRYINTGYIETNYSLEPTFRVFSCSLLADKTKCQSCLNFRKALQVQHSRENKMLVSVPLEGQQISSSDSSHTFRPGASLASSSMANSRLPVAGMREKLSACASEIKKLRAQLAYRNKKIKTLVRNYDNGQVEEIGQSEGAKGHSLSFIQ